MIAAAQWVSAQIVVAQTVLAQRDDGVIPDEPGELVIWIIMAIVIYGLYRLLLASRRRASKAYFDSRKAEEDLRRNDPDMRQDD